MRAGLWLGLAGALALMTKYWVLTMIGAIGIAALLHPERLRVPALAGAVGRDRHAAGRDGAASVVAEAGRFRAADLCRRRLRARGPRAECLQLVLGYIGHNLALFAAACRAGGDGALPGGMPGSAAWRCAHGSRGANPGVNVSQALNVWITQIVVAIGPPLGALAFMVYLKTDWGISLFFLAPLALVAIPSLRLPKIALFDLVAIWLVITLATLVAAPYHRGA